MEDNFTYTECENGHRGKGLGFTDFCPECEAPQRYLANSFEELDELKAVAESEANEQAITKP